MQREPIGSFAKHSCALLLMLLKHFQPANYIGNRLLIAGDTLNGFKSIQHIPENQDNCAHIFHIPKLPHTKKKKIQSQ